MNDEEILTRNAKPGKARNSEFCGRDLIVIFARAPVPGQVKTRLAQTLGEDKAALLYGAMLRDTIELTKRAARKEGNCEVVLCHTPRNAFDESEYSLARLWHGACVPQAEGDLGEKIFHCLEYFYNAGANRVVIIGSDSPDLPPDCINRALDLLCENVAADGQENILRRRLVLGPARDGGFYLLGAYGKIPCELFSGVEWSTPNTLSQIGNRAESLHLLHRNREALRQWEDVDTPEDLKRLAARLGADSRRGTLRAVHVARWLCLEQRL